MGTAQNEKSRGQKLRVKAKRKSIKTTAHDIGSSRRKAKLGKKQRKNVVGSVTQFISRARALRKLQISLKDFRRLCILKGVYPREPPKTMPSASKSFYSAKDIAYLAHEPLLEKFRETRAFTKKIAKRVQKKDMKEAARMARNMPTYDLDHLVRERYPTFDSALRDLDDALSLVFLFSILPADRTVSSTRRAKTCARLSREWQFYVARTQSLRKVFVSVKGIYYRAEVRGVPITWLVPHKFSQDLPRAVDFRVMRTFLEFYETLLGFVMFKLFGEDLDMAYPPAVSRESDSFGALLRAVRPSTKALKSTAASVKTTRTTINDGESSATGVDGTTSAPPIERHLHNILAKAKKIQAQYDSAVATAVEGANSRPGEERGEEEEDDDDDDAGNDFLNRDDPEVMAAKQREEELRALKSLFRNLHFYISREIPSEPVELCVEACGGRTSRQDLEDAFDPNSVTHVVTDRPGFRPFPGGERCEYVQPQWIFDSLNAGVALSTRDYAPDVKTLPPHLSPFVDNNAEGYVPARAAEIEKYRNTAARGGGTEALLEAVPGILVKDLEGKTKKPTEPAILTEEEEEEEDSDSDEDEEEDEDEDEDEDEEDEGDVALPDSRTQQTKKNAMTQVPRDFIPSDRFTGPMPGFFFRRGLSGTGYYRDVPPVKAFNADKEARRSVREGAARETEEAKEMRTMLMSRKARNLYERMKHGSKRKAAGVELLETRRQRLAEGER